MSSLKSLPPPATIQMITTTTTTTTTTHHNQVPNDICADDFARQIATLKTLQGNNRPFMVMDVQKVEEMLDEWPRHLPRVQPFYSIDCNADPVLLRLLATHPTIVGFNCNTPRAVEQAIEYVEPSQILYSNACWTRSSLQNAQRRDVNLLSFERVSELERIALSHPQAELLLNVNTGGDDPLSELGCPLEEAADLMRFAADMDVRVVGITSHLVCNGDSSSIDAAIQSVRHLFDVGLTLGLPLSILNVGDGFPPNGSTFHRMATHLSDVLNTHFPRSLFSELKVIATPGRFFAQPSLALITNVVGRRSVDASLVTGDDFDSGSEAFIYETNDSFYGSFGCRLGGGGGDSGGWEPECVPLFGDEILNRLPLGPTFGTVMGSCIDDVLQPICHFRPLAMGEWLLWRDMGAYTLNNCGTLDDSEGVDDEVAAPVIFYFTRKGSERRLLSRFPMKETMYEVELDDDGTDSCGRSASLYTLGEDETFRRCGSVASSDIPPEQYEGAVMVEEEEEMDPGIFKWFFHQHSFE